MTLECEKYCCFAFNKGGEILTSENPHIWNYTSKKTETESHLSHLQPYKG